MNRLVRGNRAYTGSSTLSIFLSSTRVLDETGSQVSSTIVTIGASEWDYSECPHSDFCGNLEIFLLRIGVHQNMQFQDEIQIFFSTWFTYPPTATVNSPTRSNQHYR